MSPDYLNQMMPCPPRLPQEAVSTAALWHESHSEKCELFLADIPHALLKNKMMNSSHLLELEECFKEIAFNSADYDDSFFQSALHTVPDLILHHSDEFLAGLINLLSESKRNIFVICGLGQSKSIPYHLYFNPRAFDRANFH